MKSKLKSIAIRTASDDPVLAFAVRELKWMLEASTSWRVIVGTGAADWVVRLKISPKLPCAAFEIRTSKPRVIELAGQDASATLVAAYTMLERAGVCFDVTGPVFPAVLKLEKASVGPVRIVPAVIERGIRQHINFTMDISSYPLAEAREYIRNLARLRYNHITFHSYPGQWYEYRHGGGEKLAGHFFYDVRHDVPDHPVVGPALRNREVFCIPEIEPLFSRHPERSRAAIAWLRALMQEAKSVGMRVQFSMEVHEEKPEEGAAACEAVLRDYPDIGTLELITPENEHKPVHRLERYLAVIDHLRAKGVNLPKLAVGIYETSPVNLQLGLDFLRANCPPDVSWTFLPAHGARAVADSIRALDLKAGDWRRTRLYSWVEFDGLMYCQQNSLLGSKMAVDLALEGIAGDRIPGLDFNHWRTAENRTAIRYAALVCMNPSLTPRAFCKDYGRALGVGRVQDFVEGLLQLDEADVFCRNHLFNIGFCVLFCWAGPKGLAWTRSINYWTRPSVAKSIRLMGQSSLLFERCLGATQQLEGREFLRFLMNRMHCTRLHLLAVDALLAVHHVCDDENPGGLSKANRTLVSAQCDAALAYCEEYMKLHAEALPDRGAEGTLVSYHETIPAYVRHIRNYFLNNEAPVRGKSKAAVDAPPPPENVPAN